MDKTEHINLKIDGPTSGFIVPDNLAMYQVTLRDYFAARAMVMFFDNSEYMEVIAEMSYDMADAMLDARNADNSDIALAEERLKTVDTAIKVDINEL